jgi:phosphatidylserine decarboxylase
MTVRSFIARVALQEDLNFLLTNRIPRRLATQFMGWFSRIEQPLVRDLSMAVWRLFADLDLSDAKQTKFKSLHDCFTRELQEGARPVVSDPAIVTSPCDAIVGAFGQVVDDQVLQVKGFPYALSDLFGNRELAGPHAGGTYVTLRLTSSMYHRFHAPHDCSVEGVTYISGDTWNVNPIALKRIEKLFCKNERAVVRARLKEGAHLLTLVPVAAILVASMRFNFLATPLDRMHRGAQCFPCNATFRKGDEMGRFEHGSTIVVFAPHGFSPTSNVVEGATIRMGEPLLRLPPPT